MNRFGFLAAAGGALLTLVLGTGCTGETQDAIAPSCTSRWVDPLVLVAQSVPTADRIPCIAALPLGWKVGAVEVRNGHATFRLDAGGGPTTRLRVSLDASCSVEGATEVPTDEPGTVRWDRLPSDSGTRMVRSYTFSGGCVTYQFELRPQSGALVDQAALAVGFLTRAEIDARNAAA